MPPRWPPERSVPQRCSSRHPPRRSGGHLPGPRQQPDSRRATRSLSAVSRSWNRRALRHQQPPRQAQKGHLAPPPPTELEGHPQPLEPTLIHPRPNAYRLPFTVSVRSWVYGHEAGRAGRAVGVRRNRRKVTDSAGRPGTLVAPRVASSTSRTVIKTLHRNDLNSDPTLDALLGRSALPTSDRPRYLPPLRRFSCRSTPSSVRYTPTTERLPFTQKRPSVPVPASNSQTW